MMSFYALDDVEQKNCLICGGIGGEGHHKPDCPVPQAEKAIAAAKQIMFFEWHVRGDWFLSSPELLAYIDSMKAGSEEL